VVIQYTVAVGHQGVKSELGVYDPKAICCPQ
jgi:hypothetical protein